ncbi:MAG: hypothetical protein LBD07_01015 [Spirochaetaceae bacterium]|jgi:hypothetical protein|nr:hypothetical protein [Spirochaetaceae bacterium]
MPAFVLSMLNGQWGPVVVVLGVLLAVLFLVIPLIRKLRLKSIKKKETRDIIKDLFTWRHLSQLVKGGDEHNKAKEELSDNIVRINELLKEGFLKTSKSVQGYSVLPWYAILGEPRSGKSTLLEASELELVPSTEESNPMEDPKISLPVRMWLGTKAVICDISGKIFFDRWLDGSSAEWSYIVRQLCRKRRRGALDGVIITIPADALLADDDNLSSKKAILIANELGKLLQQSGLRLPCYIVITKLDMVSGFQEYVKAFNEDLRHQILGFESNIAWFNEETFREFWDKLYERLRSGAKQLLFPQDDGGTEMAQNRMDVSGKIWFFPDNFASLYKNLKIYLEILFGENNFHGTKNTFFEGVYFTSAKDMGFSFCPSIAALASQNTDEVLIPTVSFPLKKAEEQPLLANADIQPVSTAIVAFNSARNLLAPYIKKTSVLRGYFIRELLHRKIFVVSPHAGFIRRAAIRRHVPQYLMCVAMLSLGSLWLFSALFRSEHVRVSFMQIESYYEWLDSILKEVDFSRSPLIKKDSFGRFVLDTEPLSDDILASRLQVYHDVVAYRDLKVSLPPGFILSEKIVSGFDKHLGYREKAFIANQLHKSMVRIPAIKNIGYKLIDEVDKQILDTETRGVIVSFVALDSLDGVDFYQFFSGPRFKLEPIIRSLMPEISNDTMELLNSYKPKYDNYSVPQMDIDYIYSQNYVQAKQAALNTILSAWKRKQVYPNSVYERLRTLVFISEEITINYTLITGALNRVHNVSSLEGVEAAVHEWKKIVDTQQNLIARGRSIFEEIRILLQAAHIPLGFEVNLPSIQISSGSKGGSGGLPGVTLKKNVQDAFGNNLINDYLFNDMIISYAVKEYTQLFEADIEFVKRELKSKGSEAIAGVIAEDKAFNGNLNEDVADIRKRARALQGNEFFVSKLEGKPDSPSLFITVERIVNLASNIPIPRHDVLNTGFEENWQTGQNNIKEAVDAFEVFVKPYIENEKVAVLISNARIMLLAQAYYNRYIIFTTSLAFLNTFEGNIAVVIESKSKDNDLFAFSGNAIESLFGSFYYNRGYDPPGVKEIIDDVAQFAALFNPGGDPQKLPAFLRSLDKRIYQPQPFTDYLLSYISYWGSYPDKVYVSAERWDSFKYRSSEYKSFQINSVLLSVYLKCIEFVSHVDDSVLSPALLEKKNKYLAVLNDKLGFLNQLLSAESEKMFAAWAALPADPFEAFTILRSVPEDELKSLYFAVYSNNEDISIGWWNSFIIDGVTILSRDFDKMNIEKLMMSGDQYKAYPLCSDSPVNTALTVDNVQEIYSLFDALGAGCSEETEENPLKTAMYHNLFKGSLIQNWAKTIWQITGAVINQQKPLLWKLHQAPVEIQEQLAGSRRQLLAINRFRYLEITCENKPPRMISTYMNEKQDIFQGDPADGKLSFKFYRTSRDTEPGATVMFDNAWAIFDLYLQRDYVADDKGNRYIPVHLEDEAGKYTYFVQIEFNVPVPSSDTWYMSNNWPVLKVSDGMIVEKK